MHMPFKSIKLGIEFGVEEGEVGASLCLIDIICVCVCICVCVSVCVCLGVLNVFTPSFLPHTFSVKKY